jgi:hypothetical protein
MRIWPRIGVLLLNFDAAWLPDTHPFFRLDQRRTGDCSARHSGANCGRESPRLDRRRLAGRGLDIRWSQGLVETAGAHLHEVNDTRANIVGAFITHSQPAFVRRQKPDRIAAVANDRIARRRRVSLLENPGIGPGHPVETARRLRLDAGRAGVRRLGGIGADAIGITLRRGCLIVRDQLPAWPGALLRYRRRAGHKDRQCANRQRDEDGSGCPQRFELQRLALSQN